MLPALAQPASPGLIFFIRKTHTFSSSKTSDIGTMSSCPAPVEEAGATLPGVLVAVSKGTAIPGHPQYELNALTQRQEGESSGQEEEESLGISFPGVHTRS